MLKDTDKIYVKGYRVYRSSNSEFRKETAILISNSIDAQTYIVMKYEITRRKISENENKERKSEYRTNNFKYIFRARQTTHIFCLRSIKITNI